MSRSRRPSAQAGAGEMQHMLGALRMVREGRTL